MLNKIMYATASTCLLLAGCIQNPADVTGTQLQGDWVEVAEQDFGAMNKAQWMDFRVEGDSFHVDLQHTKTYCDSRKAPSYTKCDSTLFCDEPPCSCVTVTLLICIPTKDTLGVQSAGGRITMAGDNLITLDGMTTDTLPARTFDGTAAAEIAFTEQFRYSWSGDTLVLSVESDAFTIVHKLVRVKLRRCGN